MEINSQMLVDLLIATTGAKTKEERARVLWRASDTMWRSTDYWGTSFPRAFNDLVQDMKKEENWPWVDNLWSPDEINAAQVI